MNYEHDIKEEEKGAEHYESLAKKGHGKQFKSMARDEEKHEGMLRKLKSAKSRALATKKK